MANGGIALQQIQEEYERSIREIEAEAVRVQCPGHAPLARGVVLMMRYHLLKMSDEGRWRLTLREAAAYALAAGVLSADVLPTLARSLLRLLGGN